MTKERFPGGYWKLHVLYRSIEEATTSQSSDDEWKQHITHLELWIRQRPASLMPRIILADVWRNYAAKARGDRVARTVKAENWKLFEDRLAKTNEILAEASIIGEKCPEWYLTSLLSMLGQNVERGTFDRLYEEGIALEPTYYYLHEAKALFLLPQWYGEHGEWERFATAAANRIGGDQGDITLFAIYSDMMSNSQLDFMDTHRKVAPRLLAGFRAIEKLYGPSLERLNEACLISFFADDNKVPSELMKRIGNEYDLSVWRSDTTFDLYRQEAMHRLERANSQ